MYFYPKFAYGAAALARGRVPLWNPHEFCGLPFLATAQVAALYPVKNVLFWLFSPPLALHVNYVVHLVLAGALAYAWARWLDLRAAAAAAGAALWVFTPYFLSSVYHPTRIMTLAWVPLVFLAYERALGRRTLGAAALAGAAIALQTYAGYPGFTLCLGALLALATVVEAARAGRGAPGVVVVAGASAALAFAFAAPLAARVLVPLADLRLLLRRDPGRARRRAEPPAGPGHARPPARRARAGGGGGLLARAVRPGVGAARARARGPGARDRDAAARD